LLYLVNQLLDLAKLESGDLHLETRIWNYADVVKSVVQEFQAIAAEKKVVLNAQLNAAGTAALIDNNRMQQVLRNVIGNAIKFSPPDSVVDIKMIADETRLQLQVTDQGPGIPEAELDRIFDKFVQSTRTSTGAGGTGLGLTISREIVEKHGGRIWATNSKPRGARFHIELPFCNHNDKRPCDLAQRNDDVELLQLTAISQ